MNHKDSFMFITNFAKIVTDALAEGDKVQLVGFGAFETRERNGRYANNPQTGEKVWIDAKKVPVFKPGKTFKEVVNK